ncbi:methylase [Kosmotoga arenicorallina S304]|uniref:Methylase n=1 Tax=Kosmotoga arenicorallina S304 TaxID=1453497 RepID=A0A176K1I8_9BACT|nr:class I SAM-dependent methyltransferase [Kosmotoga arenicorallina]OAA31007.1 methylase [Kosmotoga arenicorallina S304]
MPNLYFYPGAQNPELYELQNSMIDPDQKVERLIREYTSLEGKVLVDIGAGSGFHAHRFANSCKEVYAVEPLPGMLKQLYERQCKDFKSNLSVVKGFAEDIPLKDNIADIAFARLAYFFGPSMKYTESCEEGIKEVKRILKSGGLFFNVQNNYSEGMFAEFLRISYGRSLDNIQKDVEDFFEQQGFEHKIVKTIWRGKSREEIKRALLLEFPYEAIDSIMRSFEGTEFSYCFSVFVLKKEEQ